MNRRYRLARAIVRAAARLLDITPGQYDALPLARRPLTRRAAWHTLNAARAVARVIRPA